MRTYKTTRKVELLTDDIERCCVFAKNPQEALINLFEFIYGKELWGIIRQLCGCPKVSEITAEKIIDRMHAVFPDQKQEIIVMWVKHGFSVVDTMKPNFVKLANYELRAP